MQKVDIWLTIADHWFDADDSVNSEKFINYAAHQMHVIDPNNEDNVKYSEE